MRASSHYSSVGGYVVGLHACVCMFVCMLVGVEQVL